MQNNQTRETVQTVKKYKRLLKKYQKEIIDQDKLQDKIQEELKK